MTISDPEDYLSRRQALDISRSFIVKAPAGSGKTTLLVKRYLKLLTVVNHPEEILAITFTRKAAGELVNRVVKALTEEPDQGDDQNIDHELSSIAETARVHDRNMGWQLTSNPSRIRIQTIDSLCNYIVRQMPWSAGFGAAPATASDDVSQMYLHAARQALVEMLSYDRYREMAENVLIAVDNDFARACELLMAMLARRDQWHRLALSQQSENTRRLLEKNWNFVTEHVLDCCLANIEREDRHKLLVLGRYAAANLIESNIDSPVCTLYGLDKFPAADTGHIAIWKGIAALLLTKDSLLRETANKNIGFPPLSAGGSKNKKEEFIALLARLREKNLQNSFALIAALPDSRYSESEWQLLDSLIKMLRKAEVHLLDIFQQQATCDHIEIASRALVALGQNHEQGPSDLALRLDYAIKHLLVDEFQDTSQSQMQLIKRITAGWQDGDGRTVFFVGDPMQSIYRFRQADVGVFLNIFNNGFDNAKIETLTLKTNFRSCKSLVNWVNHSFLRVFPQADDMQVGAVSYTGSVAHRDFEDKSGGQVTHVIRRENEAVEVCRLIRSINNQAPNTSVGVLVRGRSHLAEIIAELQSSGISYQGIKIERLNNRSSIRDMMALTSALLHYGDKLSWLAVLRAPWCGLCLPDLTLVAEHASGSTVWQVINTPPDQLSDEGLARVKRLVNALTPVLERVGRQPLNHLVAGAWYALSGPETVGRNETANVKTFINLLAEIQQAGGLSELNQLETAIEDLWALSGSSDINVQLMTIHMAKGLEFDVVILPGLARRPRSDDSRLLIWKEFVASDEQSALLVSPIKRKDDDARYRFVQSLEKQSEREEIKRLLYVAATRAVQQLHLFIEPTKRTASQVHGKQGITLQSFLQPVLDFEHQPVHQTGQKSAKVEADHKLNPGYFRLPLNHEAKSHNVNLGMDVEPSADELIEYEWVGVRARHEGTLLHEIMCQLASRTYSDQNDNRKRWHNQLLSLGMHRDKIQSSIDKLQLAVNSMREDPRGLWILDGRHRQARNEWPLSALINGRLENLIIDRTFIDEHGVRWIIDYKTSTHEGAGLDEFIDSEYQRYRSQLDNYAAVLRLSESNPIRLGLYFPLLRAWREWDFAG